MRRSQKWLRIGDEAESVVAPCQSDNRPASAEMGAEQHDVFARMLHHRRVVDGFDRIRNLGFGEDRIQAVSPDDVRFS